MVNYAGNYFSELSEIEEDELLHYGVPGMKWGQRRQNRLDRIQRVGNGQGSRLDNARVGLFEVSPRNVRRTGGFQNAAASKALGMQQRKARIEKGEATVRDLLANYGGDRMIDLGNPEKRARKEAA